MKELLKLLNQSLEFELTMEQFRKVLAACYAEVLAACDDVAPKPGAGEGARPAIGNLEKMDPVTGQPLPGGQRLFETPTVDKALDRAFERTEDEPPPNTGLGICAACGSAIIQAATATTPAVCLACGEV